MKTFLVFLILILLTSCHVYQLASQANVDDAKAKFFVTTNRNLKAKHPRIHVQVDGNNFRYYYMFYKDRIWKNDFKRKGSILYQVTFDNKNTSNLSNLDSSVFKKVISIADSLQLTDILTPFGATGFVVEKYYK